MKRKVFPIVGVGASAGGLEALTEFVSNIPQDINMAFVLVQHLEPKHASLMADILSRHTKLSVVQAKNKIPIEANHIYVIPPNANLSISENRLYVTRRGKKFTVKHQPINNFLVSLAHAVKSNAIGVILSGTGTDGAEGIKAIKAAGGVTFAQDEATAKYFSMPYNSIRTGFVDFTLPPQDIAAKLAGAGNIPSKAAKQEPAAAAAGNSPDPLDDIFGLLKANTGVDFTHYRRTTILRRINRLMLFNKLKNYREYFKFLAAKPPELNTLYENLLISVTTFFRDPSSFEVLKRKILPAMLKAKAADEPVRIWAPGCSAGQEVYSLAITIFDYLEKTGLKTPVQVFGTDLNDTLISMARAGVYPKSYVKDVPRRYLEKYFVKTADEKFRINKNIRDMCIFARHNIIKDPPLSKMDIISFRNVMIYLEPLLQKKVADMLYYSLNRSGYLMLGPSESLSAYAGMFSLVDNKYKIYTKVAVKHRVPLKFETPFLKQERAARNPEMNKPLKSEPDFERKVDNIFLSRSRQGGILFNEAMDITQFRGDTTSYVQATPGKASLNILRLINEDLKAELYEAIQQAKKSGAPVRKDNVQFRVQGSHRSAGFEVIPVEIDKEKYFLALFEESAAAQRKERARENEPAPQQTTKEAAGLKQELYSTKKFLQSVIVEKENKNEELETAMEEIQSSNEELQSMNEEIETAKEELESSNEELATLNDELQNRNLELVQTNSDLNNLIASTNIPLVIVDGGLRIRRVTPLLKNFMHVTSGDIGRHISEIKLKADIPDFDKLIAGAVDNCRQVEREVQDSSGSSYSMRVKPYLTQENKNDGAVIAFIDINRLKLIQEALESARSYSRNIINTINESLLVLDANLCFVSANRHFYSSFKFKAPDVENRLIYKIAGGSWNIPYLKKLLEDVLPNKTHFENYEMLYKPKGEGACVLSLNARRIYDPAKKANLILLAILDVTKSVSAEQVLAASEQKYRELFESTVDGIVRTDAKGRYIEVNKAFLKMTGYTQKELNKTNYKSLTPPKWHAYDNKMIREQILKRGYSDEWEKEYFRKDGTTFPVSIRVWVTRDEKGKHTGFWGIVRDITKRKELERINSESKARFEAVFNSVNDAIIYGDTKRRIVLVNPAFTKLWGYSFEEVKGKSSEMLYADKKDFLNTGKKYYNTSVKKGNPGYEMWYRRKGGSTFTGESVSTFVRDAKGRIEGFVGVHRDISVRKEVEAILKRDKDMLEKLVSERTAELLKIRPELEKARRLSDIGTLASTVAHELRNPLSVIRIALHNVRRKSCEPLIAKHLDNIDKKLNESSQIINNLLFYARIQKSAHEPVNLFNIISEIAGHTLKRYSRQDVEITSNLDFLKDTIIEADPLQMKEVFNNLLNNAFDAVAHIKGKITISGGKDDNNVTISISDNGSGISKADMEHIFEPFFTTKSKGTGLGLSVVKQIITLHNGDITFQSEINKGTEVTVTLPLKAAPKTTGIA